jgi:hypothetical protein
MSGGDSTRPAEASADVVAFMASGEVFEGRKPQRIDTHAAHIFLGGRRAFKLKRPVKTGYLDFSTVDKRREALEAELRLNRRTAPGLYLGVRPINRDATGRLSLGGTGKTVDWVLEMQRFPDDALLLDRVRQGRLEGEMLDSLADRIAAFHRQARPERLEGAPSFAGILAGNAESLAIEAETLGGQATQDLVRAQRAALAAAAPLLDARAEAGRVVRGHGDLHLANIALIDGEPILFDALEFSEALATTDILYDLAFLLMDFWVQGEHQAANRVMNRWYDRMDESGEALALLPLFLSTRATIRAHVTAMRARLAGDRDIAGEARALLAHARAFLEPAAPRLVAVGGLSGTGKSTIARALAPMLGRAPGARHLRSDVIRKSLWGRAPEERLPAEAYARGQSATVYAEMERRAREALAAGQAVLLDAVFARGPERARALDLAATAAVPFTGLWLDAPLAVRVARVGGRTADASDADGAVAAAQETLRLEDPSPFVVVDASGSPDTTLASARAALARP